MTARLMRLARDPGPPWLGTALLRLALAAMFIQAGAGKFINLDLYTERFERWGFGAAPTAMALLTGATELIGGLLLAAGIAPRAVSAGLIGVMTGALLTAGRVEGGGQNVWLPLILIALPAIIVGAGGGRWALGRRWTARVTAA
jgi:putative oxidoreductase